MTTRILELIDAATMLADPNAFSLRGRSWRHEGGRACPIDWDDCSQPVFVDAVTGEYDYGEPGGPGADWCANFCPRGGLPPENR